MPRQRRIDFPGALHHVIIRGINRAPIFKDDKDRQAFTQRLQDGLEKTGLACYAWALIPNHVHLLVRTADQSLTKLMRSLLTGYAVFFNRRHNRVGYLFQNRYKSILCDEDAYLMQLVRYIHLNPLRAHLVQGLSELNNYPWSGHASLMGKIKVPWQNVDMVLRHFGNTLSKARSTYLSFIKKGLAEGRRDDLVGGGLIRSAGGWQEVKELRKRGERWRGDERILGNGDFVNKALRIAEEKMTKKMKQKTSGWHLDKLLGYVADIFPLEAYNILERKRDTQRSQARSLYCWLAVNDLGYRMTEVADYLNITKQAVAHAIHRGKDIAGKKGIEVI